MVRYFIFLLFLSLSSSILAANISVSTDRNPVSADEAFQIIFRVEGSQDGEPDFSPLNTDFQLLGTGQSSSFNMINGNMSSSKTYTLSVAPLKKGTLTIPAISFGKDKSKPITVTVQSTGYRPRASDPSQKQDSDTQLFFMTAETDTMTPYVQQQVILTVKIYQRLQWAEASLSDPEFEGVEAMGQRLGKEKSYDTQYKGERYRVTELRHALFPQESGKLTIQPFRLTAKIASGKKRRGGTFNDPFFDSLLQRQTYVTKVAHSEPIQLNIKPIPATFTGKHWLVARDVQLQENWSSDIYKLQAGEPVTRTVAIIGDGVSGGQIPGISMPEITDLKSYPDQPVIKEQQTTQGMLSTHTQKFALIPSTSGQFQLPAIEIPWWNSATDKIEIAKLPSATLKTSNTPTTISTPAISTPTSQPDPHAIRDLSDVSPSDRQIPAEINQWLLLASTGLLLLWLITLIAWLRARHQPTVMTIADKPDAQLKKQLRVSIKNLSSACNTQQAGEVRDALFIWAQIIWQKQPPHNLEAIAKRVASPLADEVSLLAKNLYGDSKVTWNASIIAREVKLIKPELSDENPGKQTDLEPLYK